MIVQCPHCEQFIFVEELNCRIFRHGVYKETNLQINPHLAKERCDELVALSLIYGCGKPFRVDADNVAVECGYI